MTGTLPEATARCRAVRPSLSLRLTAEGASSSRTRAVVESGLLAVQWRAVLPSTSVTAMSAPCREEDETLSLSYSLSLPLLSSYRLQQELHIVWCVVIGTPVKSSHLQGREREGRERARELSFGHHAGFMCSTFSLSVSLSSCDFSFLRIAAKHWTRCGRGEARQVAPSHLHPSHITHDHTHPVPYL